MNLWSPEAIPSCCFSWLGSSYRNGFSDGIVRNRRSIGSVHRQTLSMGFKAVNHTGGRAFHPELAVAGVLKTRQSRADGS